MARILIVVYLVCLTVLVGSLNIASSEDQTSPGVVVLGDQSRDHGGELQWYECASEPQLATGLMDDIPGCGDYGGDHVIEDWQDYRIVFGFRIDETGTAGPAPLTGPLEATLFWDDGETTLRCRWQQGQFESCDIPNSARPLPGQTFGFRCTSVQAAIGHGAVGHWGDCYLAHT